MTDAERLADTPDLEIKQIVLEVAEIAEQAQSYAYRFMRFPDDSMLEVRVGEGAGESTLTPVDDGGHPVGKPRALPSGPYIVGQGAVHQPVSTLREELKEAVRPEVEAEVRAELEEEPKKKWWKR